MELKPIEFKDKELFDDYFKKYPPVLSEMTFTNYYGWRNTRRIEFCEYRGHLIISFLRVNRRSHTVTTQSN